ncbi:MAG: efflux RND transporter periplasmic adaptor subunit, partial [Planctomycetaceae bacterium]|nr:efflux RND transporter periplasmic adaptor subunit [Planctomycetaceae bacterium]
VRMLGELDIEQREIERLEAVASSGSVARKTLIEREYARDKIQASLVVQREALRLHGLSAEQVRAIETQRRLLTELKLYSPSADGTSRSELNLSQQVHLDAVLPTAFLSNSGTTPMILRELHVHRGQAVNAGEPLATLVDYSQLYVEGMAFEQDLAALTQAVQSGWTVKAVFDETNSRRSVVSDLEIAYVDSEVDSASRTVKFFVRLPNDLLPAAGDRRDERFINWRYRPGQRIQLQIPAEVWEDEIVLPVDAVASEGVEFFIFQQNGDHFDRVSVHVKYRDQSSVVIANDGQVFPGDVVAMKAAHQMQMAIKNKSGGAVDPHAGHNH